MRPISYTVPPPAAADQPRQPMIRFERVSKSFAGTPAVDDLSLDIGAGDFFCLLGPSGCGKSTLLRLLAGFEVPDSGRILLDGQDLAGVPPHRRPVNMMFQSYALFPHMSVTRNIAFGLQQDRLPRAEIHARVAEMLRLVRMEPFATRYPAQLSGGQRQRVALARALAKRPKVLLLDEPLGALDRKLREDTQRELMDIQKRLGTTFVVVTHDQDEAMTVSSRIAVMNRGRLAQVGSPAEVYGQPTDRFVAEFMGDANLLEGQVVAVQPGLVEIAVPDLPVPLQVAPGQAAFTAGASVCLVLRPERMAVAAISDLPNQLSGVVLDVNFLGATTALRVRLEGGRIIRVTHANTGGRPTSLGGESVSLGFRPDHAVILGA